MPVIHAEIAVSILIFACPRTWRILEPGIETDAATLARITDQALHVACPHCQTTHIFAVSDGHLFTMRPRKARLHYAGLLQDEIDVGALITRVLAPAPH